MLFTYIRPVVLGSPFPLFISLYYSSKKDDGRTAKVRPRDS